MFSMFMLSTSDRERLTAEIRHGEQILCHVYEDEIAGGFRIDFSCEKYVGVLETRMDFSVGDFKGMLDEAVAALAY